MTVGAQGQPRALLAPFSPSSLLPATSHCPAGRTDHPCALRAECKAGNSSPSQTVWAASEAKVQARPTFSGERSIQTGRAQPAEETPSCPSASGSPL